MTLPPCLPLALSASMICRMKLETTLDSSLPTGVALLADTAPLIGAPLVTELIRDWTMSDCAVAHCSDALFHRGTRARPRSGKSSGAQRQHFRRPGMHQSCPHRLWITDRISRTIWRQPAYFLDFALCPPSTPQKHKRDQALARQNQRLQGMTLACPSD